MPAGFEGLVYLGEDPGDVVVVEMFDHLCKHGAVCAAYVKPLSF